MQTATLIQAKVKYPVDRIRQTKNGDRVKAVATPANGGDDIELWDNPNGPVHFLKKGEAVTIAWDGKRYLLIGTTPQTGNGNGKTSPAPSASSAPTSASGDIREMVAIVQELLEELPELEDGAIASLAQSIFKYRHGSK